MEVSSDRRYRFDAGCDEVWALMMSPDQFPQWWPWLTRFDGERLAQGAVWTCEVRPPLPYRLRFRIVLDEIEPPALITGMIDGDIVGTARIELRPTRAAGKCEARLVSRLSPGTLVLTSAALLAAPLIRFGHDWVLDTGARQFAARAIAAGVPGSTPP